VAGGVRGALLFWLFPRWRDVGFCFEVVRVPDCAARHVAVWVEKGEDAQSPSRFESSIEFSAKEEQNACWGCCMVEVMIAERGDDTVVAQVMDVVVVTTRLLLR
jgi:hypothetical protein